MIEGYPDHREEDFELTDEEGQLLATSFGVALWKVFGPRMPGVRLEDFGVVWDSKTQQLEFELPGIMKRLLYGVEQMSAMAQTGGDMRQVASTLADWTQAAVANDDVIAALTDLGVLYDDSK